MDISRRSFLRGLLAVSATSVVAVPALSLDSYPVLYGDGLRDDAPALNALFSDKPYVADGSLIVPDGVQAILRGSRHLISSTVHVHSENAFVSDAEFTASEDFDGDYLIFIDKKVARAVVARCRLMGASRARRGFVVTGAAWETMS